MARQNYFLKEFDTEVAGWFDLEKAEHFTQANHVHAEHALEKIEWLYVTEQGKWILRKMAKSQIDQWVLISKPAASNWLLFNYQDIAYQTYFGALEEEK